MISRSGWWWSESQLGLWNSQYMESHKIHVPNHQPVVVFGILHFQTNPDHPFQWIQEPSEFLSHEFAVFLQPQKYLDPLGSPRKCSFSELYIYKRIPTFHHSFFPYFFSISQLLGIKMSTVIPIQITQLRPQEIERHEHRTHPYTPQLFKPGTIFTAQIIYTPPRCWKMSVQ